MVRFHEVGDRTSMEMVSGGLTSIVTRILGDGEKRNGDTGRCQWGMEQHGAKRERKRALWILGLVIHRTNKKWWCLVLSRGTYGVTEAQQLPLPGGWVGW